MLNNWDEDQNELFAGIETGEPGDDDRDPDVEHVDIDVLKQKIKEQSARKKKSMLRDDDEEEKATVVGIGDVRNALKKNLVEIRTYEEHSSMGGRGINSKKSSKTTMDANS